MIVKQQAGSYILLNRSWKAGDKIVITYPMSLRIIPANDNPNVAAFAYGPILLATEMGTEGMTGAAPYHNLEDPYQYYGYDYKIPKNIPDTINLSQQKLSDNLTPIAGKSLNFTIANNAIIPSTQTQFTMMPFYNLHRERYIVYWHIKQP